MSEEYEIIFITEEGRAIKNNKTGKIYHSEFEIIEEKNKEIDRLNNIIKELSKDVDMWNKKYNEQFNIITELEKWLEERTYGMNEIHTYKIGALEDEVILNKLKALKENK